MRALRSILIASVVTTGCDQIEVNDPPLPTPAAGATDVPTESSPDKLPQTEEQWKARLSPEAYHVLREKGTEAPFTNKYDEHFEPGSYACAACGQVLFEAETKFNSGCGWPAFYAAKAGERVNLTQDLAHGMVRTEVTCARCDSHLGHVFDDAPQTPTGQRYCINSVALEFTPASEDESATAGDDPDAEMPAR